MLGKSVGYVLSVLGEPLLHGQALGNHQQDFFFNRDSGQCHLSWVEYCAGAGHLSRRLLKRHLKGACFDILYESDHNMLLASGVGLFVDALSANHSGALVWLGTPCSSFVSLCVSVSQRRAENLYYGDASRSFVAAGNAFLEITSLLYFLSTMLGNVTCPEQPLNSVLPLLPTLRNVLSYVQSQKVVTHMRAFNGPSVKPLQLWCTHGGFSHLIRPRPFTAISDLVSHGEGGSYTGIPSPGCTPLSLVTQWLPALSAVNCRKQSTAE